MFPINIFALTRINDEDRLKRLERQMSARRQFLAVREWEMESLKELSGRLCEARSDSSDLKFFFSFTMPKLGKEFDLLRVNEASVINIELKSGEVSDEAILRQLIQNKYYLAALGKSMYFYTFVSREGRLVRMSNSSRLIETSFDELADVLAQQKDCYEGHIEELFREEDYLISPLTDPDRFLRREYFLTSQQRDIRHHILKRISSPGGAILREFSMSAFTGLPGTGKSILLYDIAMQLSRRESVCLLHIGAYEKELKQLDRRLKRVDFYYCDPLEKLDLEKEYSAILIDEGHRLSADLYEDIINLAEKWQVPVIATFDKEDAVPKENGQVYGGALILETPGCISYKLTNRIRLNSELSSFISSLMRIKGRSHRAAYPSVSLSFANDEKEAARLLCSYVKEGYRYIHNGRTDIDTEGVFVPGPGVGDAASLQGDEGQGALCGIAIDEAVCKEYDKVIMLMDEAFFYDDDGYLRERNTVDDIAGTGARNLYHGLSRAKKRIAIIVKQNTDVFDSLLHVLQTS